MLNLGLLYENGQGVPQDDAKAQAWFEKAAAAGDVTATGALLDLKWRPELKALVE